MNMQRKRLSISYDIGGKKPDIKKDIEQLRELPGEYSGRSIADIAGVLIQKHIGQELERVKKNKK